MARAPEASRLSSRVRRLWQPRSVWFWQCLAYNLLSSVCAWMLRSVPLTLTGTLVVGTIGLLNVAMGLWAAWRLWETTGASPGG